MRDKGFSWESNNLSLIKNGRRRHMGIRDVVEILLVEDNVERCGIDSPGF